MASALVCVKDTLIDVKIRIGYYNNEQPFYTDDVSWIRGYSSLKGLAALEAVTTPSGVLLGWYNDKDSPSLADVLPPNVITICLTYDLGGHESYAWHEKPLTTVIEEFVGDEKWRTTTSHFRDFNLVYHNWEEKNEISGFCERNGLTCCIKKRAPLDS